MSGLQGSQDHTAAGGVASVDEQRKWFPGTESVPAEGAVRTDEMRMQDLEYHIISVHKAAAGCKRLDSSVERSSTG